MIEGNKVKVKVFKINGPKVRLQRLETLLRVQHDIVVHPLKAFKMSIGPSFIMDVEGPS